MARDVRKVVESEDEIVDGQEEEEEYDENADEDFNPEQAAAEEDGESSGSSDDEAEAQKFAGKKGGAARGRGKKRKLAATAGQNEEDEGLDSGDEATIRERQKSRKKQKKRGKGDEVADVEEDDDDSAGEGIVIKTRAQRLAEQVEKKQRKRRVDGSAVTIDVDSLWADLSAMPVGRPAEPPSSAAEPRADGGGGDGEADKENVATPASTAPQQQQDKKQSELVTIKRRIEYAGEVTEVEERVPRGSKEAQAYLAEHPEAATEPSNDNDSKANPLRRPLRRASIFEPNPTGAVKGVPPDRLRPRAPSRLDVLMARKRAEEELKKKAERLSTVQKSALDWRGFVNSSEGLRDELDVYGKSKQGFLAREAFLDRAAGARDAAAREARLKG